MSKYTILRSSRDLSDLLKSRRKTLRLNQGDVAAMNDVSRYTIVGAESGGGDPKLSTILRLLEALGMSLVAVPSDLAERISLPEFAPDAGPNDLEWDDWDLEGDLP